MLAGLTVCVRRTAISGVTGLRATLAGAMSHESRIVTIAVENLIGTPVADIPIAMHAAPHVGPSESHIVTRVEVPVGPAGGDAGLAPRATVPGIATGAYALRVTALATELATAPGTEANTALVTGTCGERGIAHVASPFTRQGIVT